MAEKKTSDNKSNPITAPTDTMRQRMFFVVFLVTLVFAGYITGVLYNVAINKSEYYRSKANNQQVTRFTINANRGTIYDRNGKILAQSTTVWDVIVNPYQIKTVDALDNNGTEDDTTDDKIDTARIKFIADGVASILKIDAAELYNEIMESDMQYYVAKKKIDRETQTKLENFILENDINEFSVYPLENSKRYYPNDSLASKRF